MRFSKVFGIGLPRTGTTSLNIALNTIGISSVHFPFSLYDSEDFEILDQHTGFVDSPIPHLYQTLDKLCPNSCFILTTRPVEGWLKSMKWLLEEGSNIWVWKPEYDVYHADFFGSASFDHDLYQCRYHDFHTNVTDYFQGRDNLLILDLEMGYGYKELCSFLGVPICQNEYPLGNKMRHPRRLQRIASQVGSYSQSCEHLIRRLDYYISQLEARL